MEGFILFQRGRAFSLLYVLVVSVLALSCTKNEGTTIRFEMPDWQKTVKSEKVGASGLAVRRLPARIMINISGPGIEKPLVTIWQSDYGMQPPSSFELIVPRGSSRLFQVLAITRDLYFDADNRVVADGAESFFYGDVTKELANQIENVEIALQEISLGEQGLGEGVITGRYLDQDGTGPTGKVNIYFQPPNAPPMIVAQSELHGGWFQFFRIDGVNFFYELEDGRRLFERFSLDYPGFEWGPARALFRYPKAWRNIGGNPENGRKPVPQKHLVTGYFGPGAGNRKVCLSEGMEKPLGDLYVHETGDERVMWVGKKESLSAGEAGVSNGSASPGECEGGTRFENRLYPSVAKLGSVHEAMGFMGPFQQVNGLDQNPQYIEADYVDPEAKKVELKWRYLPGVTGPGRISGVEIFARVLPPGVSDPVRREYEDGDGIHCGELTNKSRLSLPFAFKKSVSYDPNSLEQTAEVAGIDLGDWETGRVQFVICPYKDRNEYFRSGVVYDRSKSNLVVKFTKISAGLNHTCGLTSAGRIYCWGLGENGRLGNDSSDAALTPQRVKSDLVFKDISAGYHHTCGIAADDKVYCWGRGDEGQLGHGLFEDAWTPQKVQFEGDSAWVQIVAGGSHTCGITNTGEAYCWGWGYYGQLGNESTENAPTPQKVQLAGNPVWTTISASGNHTCGIISTGDAYCWGYGSSGQLGNGSTEDKALSPQLVLGEHTWKEIAAAGVSTCGITDTDDAYCWGHGEAGQLGTGSTSDVSTPSLVAGGLKWKTISRGVDYHVCGITNEGKAYCWGLGEYGQLGHGMTTNTATPQLVSGGHIWKMISVGQYHTCGIITGDETYCWGAAGYGQLGNGSTQLSLIPKPLF